MPTALAARGLQAGSVAILMRELTGVSAVLEIPSAGVTKMFPYTRGGKQGAVETPDVWNSLVEFCMEPLIPSWRARGFGFHLEEEEYTHAVWADNIFLFSSRESDICIMTQELS